MVQGHLLPLLPEIMCVTSQAMSSHGLPSFAHLMLWRRDGTEGRTAFCCWRIQRRPLHTSAGIQGCQALGGWEKDNGELRAAKEGWMNGIKRALESRTGRTGWRTYLLGLVSPCSHSTRACVREVSTGPGQ